MLLLLDVAVLVALFVGVVGALFVVEEIGDNGWHGLS
jgi:hypothetical protein